jgi:peptide/nickel transport system permease protein
MNPRAAGAIIMGSSRTLLRRLAHIIPVVIGIACLNFLILKLMPGDMVDVLAGNAGGATPEYMAHLRQQFGLDQPVPIQLIHYLKNVAVLNLGVSALQGQPVLSLIAARLPTTLLLMGMALTIAVVLGGALGVIGARRAGTKTDSLISTVILVFHAMPSFWFGLMAIVLFSVKLRWLPSGGLRTLGDQGVAGIGDLLLHLILPGLTLANFHLAIHARLMRNRMLELMGADFIKTARAKGASETRVTYVHALRNALLPMVTTIGLQVSALLSGSVVVESVFGLPGLGRLTFEALLSRDINLLLGILLLSSILVTVLNTLIDLLYGVLDPRVTVWKARS